MNKIDQCLEILREDMNIHMKWIEWNVKNERHINDCQECKLVQGVAGNGEHHAEWAGKYAFLIDTLEEFNGSNQSDRTEGEDE